MRIVILYFYLSEFKLEVLYFKMGSKYNGDLKPRHVQISNGRDLGVPFRVICAFLVRLQIAKWSPTT